jgi:hypothetical protein
MNIDECFGNYSLTSDKCEGCSRKERCQKFQDEEIAIQNGLAPVIMDCPLKNMFCILFKINGCKNCSRRKERVIEDCRRAELEDCV